jgi:uracil permease
MFKHVDLEDSRNLFVVAAILVTGIGGLSVSFGKITITNVACALIVGIITNLLLNRGKKTEEEAE